MSKQDEEFTGSVMAAVARLEHFLECISLDLVVDDVTEATLGDLLVDIRPSPLESLVEGDSEAA